MGYRNVNDGKTNGFWVPNEEQLKQLESLAGYGLPERDLAAYCEVSISTFQLAEKKSIALSQCLSKGRMKANSQIAQSAYKQAISGKSPALTIFWLKTRLRWKEPPQKIQHTGRDGGPIETSKEDVEERKSRIRNKVEKLKLLGEI